MFTSIAFLELSAQGVGNGGKDHPSKGVPIDGGASWLAAAGAAYGVKKYRDYRKKQQDENEPEA